MGGRIGVCDAGRAMMHKMYCLAVGISGIAGLLCRHWLSKLQVGRECFRVVPRHAQWCSLQLQLQLQPQLQVGISGKKFESSFEI
eukprot:182951-Chlamydomonas_euryale.AAC.2